MYILWIIMTYLLICIIRVVKGPTVWDRLLGLNLISAKVIMIIILFASINETAYILDFAIVYALLGFIGTIFVALFLLERIIVKNKRREKGGAYK